MKNDSPFKDLLKELGRDPRVKRVIAKRQSRGQPRGKSGHKIESLTEIALLLLAIASRFVSKKKARAIDELMDTLYLLVQVSLLLKENVFDRPEVKEFFGQSWKEIYLLAQKYVAIVLPKTKGLRPMRKSRPV